MSPETMNAERHTKLMDRGWTWVYARELRPLEWVRQWGDFKRRALQTARIGNTVYARFADDELPYRHWPHNFRIRVNYPRHTQEPQPEFA